MSAMLETYDMPMLDYPTDLDIQMHPSSDQWFPDEAQMEEDAPGVFMKPENYSPPKAEGNTQMKTDNYSQEKTEVTIEVDMEPLSEHQNAEYAMEDDEDIHHSGGENLDVEVYDVSLAQSPFMAAVDVAQDGPSNFLGSFEHPDTTSLSNKTSPIITHDSGLPPLEPRIFENPPLDNIPVAEGGQVESHDFQLDARTEVQAQTEISEPAVVQEHDLHSSHTLPGSHPSQDPAADNPLPTETANNISETEVVVVEPLVQAGDGVGDNQVHNQDDQAEIDARTASDNALGDPHEISEGVYIDPPPPVLLSVASEDQFDFSFFNESPDWNSSSRSDGQSHSAGRVFLHHLPTLYYEPLSSVFDALREEEYVQSMFHLAESELVLDAVDLQLTISEDNVYAREVTIHDLNVLHDVSGINGLLRMRLYASAPRFITRYQYLQDHVSQLTLELPAEVPLVEINQEEVPHEGIQEVHNHVHEEEQRAEAYPSEQHTTEEHPTEEHHIEEHIPGSANTSEPLPETLDQGNENNSHNDAESEAHTAESFDPETDLPPLPEEDNDGIEAEEEMAEGAPLPQDNFDPSTLNNGGIEFSEQPTASETEVEQVIEVSFNKNEGDVVTLETLEGPHNADGQPYAEEERADREYREENQAEEEHTEYVRGEEDHVQEEYSEHVFHEHAEFDHAEFEHAEFDSKNEEAEYQRGEYAGDELAGEEHAGDENAEDENAEDENAEDDFYQEDGTDSHNQEDQLKYAEEEEADTTLETETLETPLVDLTEFDDVHPNVVDGAADESFAVPGSHYDQALNEGTTEGDHASTSEFNVQEKGGLVATETYTTTTAITTTKSASATSATEQFEDGTEFENATYLDTTVDPTVQEAYEWEDNLDGEDDPDTPLEGDNEDAPSHSNHSSVTLSSKASKRSFDEFDLDGGYENEDGHWSPSSSPGPKRTRTQ